MGSTLLLFFLLHGFSSTAHGMARRMPEPSYAPGELIVAFHETVSDERILEIVGEEGGRIGKALGGKHLFLILLSEKADIPKAAERFSVHPEVRFAEPNYRVELLERK